MAISMELMGLLACPACRAKLASLDACIGCGESFSSDDRTPVLIPSHGVKTVSFQFEIGRSVPGPAFERAFTYPPRCGAAQDGAPHHLDLAHLDVIERLPPGARILEIGCGGGQMRQFLRGKGFEYIGTDISKTRIPAELRAHGGPDVLCDAHFLPFVDGSFDVVYSAAVTEHLASPFVVAQEALRVLRPGGYYLGNVSFLEPWHDNSFFHMTPMGVFELLTQARFEVDHIWPGRGYHGFGAVLRMASRATRPLTFVGSFCDVVYRLGNRVRDLARGTSDAIGYAARVAGATDWVARRSVAAAEPALGA